MANPLRKTMVYLGLADEEEYEDATPSGRPVPLRSPRSSRDCREPCPVTPLRRPRARRRHPLGHMNEILTVHPRQYKDAQIIAENFREGVPVIINLSQMTEPSPAPHRFACGLSQGLYGKIERVTSKVFLLSPAHVAVSGDAADVEPEVDAAFFGR